MSIFLIFKLKKDDVVSVVSSKIYYKGITYPNADIIGDIILGSTVFK